MIARDPLLGLFAFYAARGMPLQALAAASPAEIGFLEGARALYYEETIELIRTAVVQAFVGGEQSG